MRGSILALTLVLAAAPAAAQTASTAAPAAAAAAPAVVLTETQWILLGRQVTEWLWAGQTDSILAHSSPDAMEHMGGAEGLVKARDELMARLGSETDVIADKMTKRKGNTQYWRESKYELGPPEPVVLRFVFNAQAQIIGIGIGPLNQVPAPDPS